MTQRYILSAGFSALIVAVPNTAAAAQDDYILPMAASAIGISGLQTDKLQIVADAHAADAKPVTAVLALDVAAPVKLDQRKTEIATILAPSDVRAPSSAPTTNAVKSKSGENAKPACGTNSCKIAVTPAKLLQMAETFIAKRDFASAAPLVEALGMAPEYKFQHLFLTGYIQVETGKLKEAESTFRTLLHAQPGQTRIRLELARVLTMRGKKGAANYHFRLAQKAGDLPEDIRRAVTGVRSILRSQRNWRFGVDFGFAPDTNINNATSAETVDVNFGPLQIPLTLNEDARQTSGVGQTAGINAGLRLKAGKKMAVLFDLNTRLVNYKGTAADDFQIGLAIGPERRISDSASISLQALGQRRWYGGRRANTDFGARIGLQKILNEGQRIGLSIDGRNTKSGFGNDYSGWVLGGNANYERVIGKSFIASAGLFARKAMLNSQVFSNTSFGVSAGIGGELPLGLNAGINGSISRATFNAPQLIYSTDNRKDWRMFGRAHLGVRAFRFLGFSPSVEYNFSKVSSNYIINRSKRHRFNFKFARYF